MTDTAAASRAPASAPSGVGPAGEQREAECHGSRAPVGASSGVDPEQIAALAEPLAADAGCALYDVQWRGGTLVVLATASGGGAVGVDALSRLSRGLSAALDADDLIDGRYVLEVSSPGLERRLRRPDHFAGAVGEQVVIRTSTPPRQRIVGEVLGADGDGVRVRVEESDQPVVVPFGDIAKARTTFEWGSSQRPTSGNGRASSGPSRKQAP